MTVIRYDDVICYENLEASYRIIRKNTKHREKLLRYEMFYFSNMKAIELLLKSRKYQHGKYNIFLIREPKYRLIMSEGLSDKIVNHLVSKYVLQPLVYPKIISSNVATRKNKGTSSALNYFKYYVNKLKQKHSKIYILKCDIKKYFYNIDHEILLEKLKNIVLDEELYLLIENIVKSTNEKEINSIIDQVVLEEINRLKKVPGNQDNFLEELSRMPRYNQGKGLPIGNMTSQILALFYLNDLDHYIKEQLNIKYYIRYMDDFMLFHSDKEYLKECRLKIEKYLKELKLSLNQKTQIYDLDKGVNFLGYRFQLINKKLVINTSSKTKRKIIKRLRYLRKKVKNKYLASKISYKGYFDVAFKNNYKKIIRKIEKNKID